MALETSGIPLAAKSMSRPTCDIYSTPTITALYIWLLIAVRGSASCGQIRLEVL